MCFMSPRIRKFIWDSDHVYDFAPFKLKEDSTYEEKSLCIMDLEEQVLDPALFIM